MTKNRAVTVHQYEPLPVPSGWREEEARLVRRLTEIFDDIYRRYGRLGLDDISTAFSDALGVIRSDVAEAQETADQALEKAEDALANANNVAVSSQTALPIGCILSTFSGSSPKTAGVWSLYKTETSGSDTIYLWKRIR